ncbi:D-glycerate dehydrogenase [Rossellomorea vietnamensis]|uniref:D-glycerate dehydrogenase n=1 Tax=Rossellomorea vietnamensis TaxID=218284 RepID=A0ACD4CDY9_9BACI|nr:D-glycerate dehydrogenase [Rossellomorea vietnamensis]UXH46820.1 D-glycerate dehydrogenase [Rossellomorea vietnamensis]
MKPKVFIAKPIPQEVEDYLSSYCDYKVWEHEEPIPYERLIEELQDVVGLITPKGVITEDLLNHAPKLKLVSNIAAGYDAFDLKLMEERRVLGTHTPYVLDETVADLVFGLILSSARRISELDSYVKKGKWVKNDDPFFFGVDVHHATLGIIGLGRIGEKVVRRATAGFGMSVLYHNRSRRPEMEQEYGIEYSEMDALLQKSDFVLLMVPLSEGTYHLMDTDQFKRMKSSAFFINCSRGKTVNEPALIQALEEKWIRGAALDVYEQEPIDRENPLLKMKNVVTTPHIGSATQKARFDMALKAAENMVEYLKGNTPPNVVKELRHLTEKVLEKHTSES